MSNCQICGMSGFKNWKEYNDHHRHRHNVSMDTGVPRLDFTEMLNVPKVFKSMDKAIKTKIVEKVETKMRLTAWENRQLNPLIGTDNISTEPVWNDKGEVI